MKKLTKKSKIILILAIIFIPITITICGLIVAKFYKTTEEFFEEISIADEVEETPDLDITIEPFNLYISGIDTSGDIEKVARSDVNMLVTVNPKTSTILLTSIPRDYYVAFYGKEGLRDKLTHSGVYGIETTVKTVENLFDTKIEYYARINFDTLVELVDEIGGIEIESDASFTNTQNGEKCDVVVGKNYMDGNCALAFSRERKEYNSGDRHRVENQQLVLKAIIEKISNSETLLQNYQNILNKTANFFQTTIPAEYIEKFVKVQLSEKTDWKIERYSVDGTGKYDYTYTYPNQQLYVMEPNLSTVNTAIEKINQTLNEEKQE